jgi:general secretion pathway protein G
MQPTILRRSRVARTGGLTLIELLIAIAIVALLAAVAVPSYFSHLERNRVQVAVLDLNALQMELQRHAVDRGEFPATLADVRWTKLDPWGNPYQYLRMAGANNGAKRKDRNLVPINTDYDLYSMGPDGRSVAPLTAAHSRDDIVRAGNGRFIGKAEDF